MQKIALFSICAVLAAFLGVHFGDEYTTTLDKASEDYNVQVEKIVAEKAAIREKAYQEEKQERDQTVDAAIQFIEESELKYQRFIEAREPAKAAEVYMECMRLAPNPTHTPKECILLAYCVMEKSINPHLSEEECVSNALSAMVKDHKQLEALLARYQE